MATRMGGGCVCEGGGLSSLWCVPSLLSSRSITPGRALKLISLDRGKERETTPSSIHDLDKNGRLVFFFLLSFFLFESFNFWAASSLHSCSPLPACINHGRPRHVIWKVKRKRLHYPFWQSGNLCSHFESLLHMFSRRWAVGMWGQGRKSATKIKLKGGLWGPPFFFFFPRAL